MKITEITLEEALGKPLAHDLTKIDAKNGFKGARFKKGHILVEEDLQILRDMGKEHLAVLTLSEDELHEDEAALTLCRAIKGENLNATEPSEGRIILTAAIDGLLGFKPESVNAVNEDVDWVLATLGPHRPVVKGQPVAGFRIRPLSMEKQRVLRAAAVCSPIDVLPFKPLRAALITTGREIAEGRVEDAFAARFRSKLDQFGGSFLNQRFVTDDASLIAKAVTDAMAEGAELVVCTGGMSVDIDDRTPGAIAAVCGEIAFRGVPVLPGAMLMMGWAERGGQRIPVLGAPACVVHDERTVLDRVLALLLAGVDPAPLVRGWGVGGLCEHCDPCRWPHCSFAAAY